MYVILYSSFTNFMKYMLLLSPFLDEKVRENIHKLPQIAQLVSGRSGI